MSPRRRKKRLFPKLFLLTLILLTYGGFRYYVSINSPIDENDNSQISFQIKPGENVKKIAENLENKELIHNATTFYLHVKHKKLGPDIVAGRFLLAKSMNVPEIIENISNPSQAETVITIQEGLTIKDIDQKLADQKLSSPGEFTIAVENFNSWNEYPFLSPSDQQNLSYPLEGYIYPDTYFLDPLNFNPNDLIHLALNNFQNKTTDLNLNANGYSTQENITMASIIENEVFGQEDRPIVSGILWKRLENNWTIGADITLIYITNDRSLSAEDLAIDSPYNTRKNLGLPPGPISNPSVESINAALNPSKTEHWFYLTTLDTGEVIYADSNEEHNANRAKHL